MKKTILILIYILSFSMGKCQVKYDSVRAFTHPIDILHSISIYSAPNVYLNELSSDSEGGWIVNIKQKRNNYFMIYIEDKKLDSIWIHIGDVGVVIQNYDSIALPIYSEPDINSRIINYNYSSCIGLVYDISKRFLLLQIITDNDGSYFGWVERKYLCFNPYTSCG